MEKVLFVSHVLDNSGAPRSLLSLLKHMPSNLDLEIDLLSMRRKGMLSQFSEVLKKTPTVLTPFPPSNKFMKLIERLSSIPRLIYFLKKAKPSLVVVNSAANSRAIVFSKLLGYKVFVYVREYDEMFVSLAKLRASFLVFADKLFITNKYQKSWVEKYAGKNKPVSIIPNGVDFHEVEKLSLMKPDSNFLRFAERFKFLVGNACFLNKRKGCDLYAKIICKMKDRKDIGFVLVGDFVDYKDKKAFLKLLAKEGVEDRFFYTGITDNVFSYYKYLDVMAVTSRSEVFPRVILESMAMGLTVVAFDIKGNLALLSEEYPFLVPSFDIDKFSYVLLDCLGKTEKEKRFFGKKLKTKSREYDITKVAERFFAEIKV